MLRNEKSITEPSGLRLPKNILVSLLLLTISVLANTTAHSAWFDSLIPEGETYTVREIDRDLAFVVDGFIYDARTSCFLAVGDRVVFLKGVTVLTIARRFITWTHVSVVIYCYVSG